MSFTLLSKWSDEEARNVWLCRLYGYGGDAEYKKPEAGTSSATASASNVCPQRREERVLQQMRWGFMPEYLRGALNEFPLVTNNARAESLVQKPLFRRPILSGHRCVVVADGFARSLFAPTLSLSLASVLFK